MRFLQTIFVAAALFGAAIQTATALELNDAAHVFIDRMVTEEGFSRGALERLLAATPHNQKAIDLITPPSRKGGKAVRSWPRYRSRFLAAQHIGGGVDFWHENRTWLTRAANQYGVPAEIIVAILGVETRYGGYTGNFETLSVLSTLAFYYPPRADLFGKELRALLLLARREGRSPTEYSGSYAGALGYPQFLPSSIAQYGVDFDGDGRIDFDRDAADAIGSIANYLAVHGWQRGAPVAEKLYGKARLQAAQKLVEKGILPALRRAEVEAAGLHFSSKNAFAEPLTLVDLPAPGRATEYWAGYQNFYVITRYNRSSFYAMSVFQLAEAIRLQMDE